MYGQAATRPYTSQSSSLNQRFYHAGAASDLVNVLFSRANLTRHHKASANTPKVFDQFLQGLNHTSKLTAEDKKQKTGLAEMISSFEEGQPLTAPRLWVFSEKELENELKLQVPRKVQSYVAPATASAPAPRSQKSKETVKKMRDANTASSKVKRNQAAVDANHYVSDEMPGDDSAMFEDSIASRKRTRYSAMGGDDDGGGGGGGGGGYAQSDEPAFHLPPLPKNFIDVIDGIFQYFWGLDFGENTKISEAFFARINKMNCRDYGLANFSEASSGLATIDERLKATKELQQARLGLRAPPSVFGTQPYRSIEDFYSDFRTMFDNVYKFFPSDHPALPVAREQDAIFAAKWQEANKAFTYDKPTE